MRKFYLLLLACIFTLGVTAQTQVTLAYFSFSGLNGNSDVMPNMPKLYMADDGMQAGTAGLYADGTHGSSLLSDSALNNFSGSTINLWNNAAKSRDFAVVSKQANGKGIVFHFSTTGISAVQMTYAYKRTITGFDSLAWSYSTDGENFTEFLSETTSGDTYEARSLDLSTFAAINNQENVYLKVTFDGCTSGSGNNRIDNVKIDGMAAEDNFPPVYQSRVNYNDSIMTLTFSEDLNTNISTANFVLTDNVGNAAISSATVTGNVVLLIFNPTLTEGNSYTLEMNNISDLAGNVMNPYTLNFKYGVAPEFHVATIAELRSKLSCASHTGSIADTVVYKLTGHVVVTAYDRWYHQTFIQDETGAIMLYDNISANGDNPTLGQVAPGDEISGIYCKLTNYWGYLEAIPQSACLQWHDSDVDVEPMTITLDQISDQNFMMEHQAELIKLENTSIDATGSFNYGKRYVLSQGGVTDTALCTYFQYANYIGNTIPSGNQTIIGVNFAASKIYSNTYGFRYYIVPRIKADISGLVGIIDATMDKIAIYPNPTADIVNVNIAGATVAEIYDMNGRKVAAYSIGDNAVISLQNLSQGSYIMRVMGDNQVLGFTKLIKK